MVAPKTFNFFEDFLLIVCPLFIIVSLRKYVPLPVLLVSAVAAAIISKAVKKAESGLLESSLRYLLFLTAAVYAAAIWNIYHLGTLFLFSMALLHAHYVFSPTYWVYRYDAYLAGFAVFAAGVSTAPDSRPRLPAFQKRNAFFVIACAVLAAAALLPAEFPGTIYPAAEVSNTRSNYFEHVLAANFLNRYHPDGPVVINDIGAIGFFTEARILDMFGLADLEPLRFREGGRAYTRQDVRDWSAARGARIAILQVNWHEIQPRIPEEWVRVGLVVTPARKTVGFFAVDPGEARSLRRHLGRFYGLQASRSGLILQLDPPQGKPS